MKKKSAGIEVKLVTLGNKVFGTIYHYGSGPGFIRYSIKGGLSENGQLISWQDYSMISMNLVKTSVVKNYTEAMRYLAKFNSPVPHIFTLEGTCMLQGMPEMRIELRKKENTFFPDEWDAVISGQIAAELDKVVLDSVWAIASEPVILAEPIIPAGVGGVKKVTELTSGDSEQEHTDDLKKLPSVFLLPEERLSEHF